MPLYTNHVLDSSDLSAASGWSNPGNFVIASATSIIPKQTAYQHTADGGSFRFRARAAGTFTAAPETSYFMVENIDALKTKVAVRDVEAGQFVVEGFLNDWSTADFVLFAGAAGSAASGGLVPVLDPGPNGGTTYLILVSATPSNPGNTRQLWIYPSGTDANAKSVIVHHAQLEEAGTRAPIHIVTTTAAKTVRAIDLSTYPIVEPVPVVYDDLRVVRTRFNGTRDSEIHSDAVVARRWRFRAERMSRTVGEALVSDVDNPGYVWLTGQKLIHDTLGVGVRTEAQTITQDDGPLEDHVSVSFEALEVDP